MATSSFGQAMSDLLTVREKSLLLRMLEPQCQLIKTTVAQILQAKDTEGEILSWHRLDCGVVCLVEDQSVSSYFLRLYCITRAELLWEQELYVPLKYTASRAYFHTFPAEDHQVGINFANETEAEEFHLAVKAVHETMNMMINTTTNKEVRRSSSSSDSMTKAPDKHLHEEPVVSTAPLATSSFSDLDPVMSSLLIRAMLTEEDLKNKDVSEVVDCIINQFGGVKAVQRELKKNVSKTLPRAVGASISGVLNKGPLPPLPFTQSSIKSQQTPGDTDATDSSQLDSYVSFDPPSPTPGRIRRSASHKDVDSFSAAAEGRDLILAALREAFKQKQILRHNTPEGQNESDTQTDDN